MKLYHGTHGSLLTKIQAKGLVPRGKLRTKGNWGHSIVSNPKAVYLTDAYPWHFALNSGPKKLSTGLILEIDKTALDRVKLCPDEDFMEQATRRNDAPGFAPIDWCVKDRTEFYKQIAVGNPHLFTNSLEGMGTAAYYGTIPWSAVTRYVEIDWKKIDKEFLVRSADSLVSIVNYQILANRHKAFVRWFFDDPVKPEELIGDFASLPVEGPRMVEAMAKVMANREGVKVTKIN